MYYDMYLVFISVYRGEKGEKGDKGDKSEIAAIDKRYVSINCVIMPI